MIVTSLHRYPIKSCAGQELQEAKIGNRGIEHDREWMVVDGSNQFLTQRQIPQLALVQPTFSLNELILSAPGCQPVHLPLKRDGQETTAKVWEDQCLVIEQGPDAASWLSSFLKKDCRLVRMPSHSVRELRPGASKKKDRYALSLVDDSPFLVISEASLADLNRVLSKPVPMNRFRPNIVVSGSEPYAEDAWEKVEIAGVELNAIKPCVRCVITSIDQEKAKRDEVSDPFTAIKKYHPALGGGGMFGHYFGHISPGIIKVGDSIEIVERRLRSVQTMNRITEPELMTDVEQAKAYALADFSEPHSNFIRRFQEVFPHEAIAGHVLDLGCGPGDITFRFARAYPDAQLIGIDGSKAMLDLGRQALLKEPSLQKRINFIEGYIPQANVPVVCYEVIISNSILHHLHQPQVLWDYVLQHSAKGTRIFIMDLMRPESEARARELTTQYAGNEPEILQRDFYNSLLAAFLPGEVSEQLKQAGLSELKVETISDRHLLVHGKRT